MYVKIAALNDQVTEYFIVRKSMFLFSNPFSLYKVPLYFRDLLPTHKWKNHRLCTQNCHLNHAGPHVSPLWYRRNDGRDSLQEQFITPNLLTYTDISLLATHTKLRGMTCHKVSVTKQESEVTLGFGILT